MPLVSVRIGSVSSGRSFILLLEKFSGADYIKVASALNQMAETPSKSVSGGLQKPFVKMLLNLAQSPRE